MDPCRSHGRAASPSKPRALHHGPAPSKSKPSPRSLPPCAASFVPAPTSLWPSRHHRLISAPPQLYSTLTPTQPWSSEPQLVQGETPERAGGTDMLVLFPHDV